MTLTGVNLRSIQVPKNHSRVDFRVSNQSLGRPRTFLLYKLVYLSPKKPLKLQISPKNDRKIGRTKKFIKPKLFIIKKQSSEDAFSDLSGQQFQKSERPSQTLICRPHPFEIQNMGNKAFQNALFEKASFGNGNEDSSCL